MTELEGSVFANRALRRECGQSVVTADLEPTGRPPKLPRTGARPAGTEVSSRLAQKVEAFQVEGVSFGNNGGSLVPAERKDRVLRWIFTVHPVNLLSEDA